MKFIELEVLCKDVPESEHVDENQAYRNVLEELNLTPAQASDEDSVTFWKTISFNVKVLEDEVFSIEERVDYEETNSVMSFFDNRTAIINMSRFELTRLLNDTL